MGIAMGGLANETKAGAQVAERARIWVVDDSPLEAQRLCKLLEASYDVEAFAEGAALLERIFEHGKPDLVLLDWQMPGISGVDACKFLRERYDEVSLPILMLTARGSREDFTEGLSAGANDYVAKPYDPAELLARVRTLVRTRQQAEAMRVREEWFATTLRSIGDAVITTRVDGQVTFVNRIAEAITGWSADEAVGMAFEAVFDVLDETTRQKVPNLILEGHPPGQTRAMLLRRKDGSEVAIEETVSVLGDGGGRGAVMVFRDVTERRIAERAAKKRADFEEKLIGIVSHDLRSPLNVVALSTSLLLNVGQLNDADRKIVERLRLTGQRASRLVSDLLDFTQARLGNGIPVSRRVTDIHVIGSHILEESQATSPERTLRHESTGNGAGRWDPDRLAQLLMNLVSNALKYGHPTTEVVIRTRGEVEEIVLEVHNQGTPIPAELLPVVFEPMRRGALTQGDRSVGLGLYIVKDIVDAHGGKIAVSSTTGEGTTFTVRLPRATPPAPTKSSR